MYFSSVFYKFSLKPRSIFCGIHPVSPVSPLVSRPGRQAAGAAGFAADNAAYKAAPQNYAGSVSDAAEVVRVAITGSPNSPDLCTIMGILGRERSLARITKAAASL